METITKHDHVLHWQGLRIVVGPSEGRFGKPICKEAAVQDEQAYIRFLNANEHVRPLDAHLPEWVSAHYVYIVGSLWESAEQARKDEL